jgi:AcrR family transcriptional regulator
MLMATKRARPAAAADVRARRLSAPAPPDAPGNGRLSPGPVPIGQIQLAQIQRSRLLTAMVGVACERGAADVTVADVTARCGVSRRTFYELFRDSDDCFIAACEEALSLATARVLPAVQAERKWVDRLRAGIAAFMCFLDEEPKLGQLLVCESLVAGRRVLDLRMQVTGRLAEFLHEGRHEGKLGGDMPLLYAEGAVGGVLSILQNLLISGHDESFVKLAGSLTSMLVMPYLGPADARRELELHPIPVAKTDARNGHALADPFKHAGMRLTYRTVRVLLAVAELGGRGTGPSNRIIGEAAGMRDQGQVSKLLRRLVGFELIENVGLAPGQGAPNAWTLTSSGRRIVDSVRAYTDVPAEGK